MEGEGTNKTTNNTRLGGDKFEYVWPEQEIWVGKEGGKLRVSVKVTNSMWTSLRQEGDKWMGSGVWTTLVRPFGEEAEREREMYALMSNITDVRMASTKTKGVMVLIELMLIRFSAGDTLVLQAGDKKAVFVRGKFKRFIQESCSSATLYLGTMIFYVGTLFP